MAMMKGLLNDQKFVEGDVSVDRLQIDKCIGRGNCDVYLAENSGSRVALKQNEIKSDYEYKNFLQEIATLKSLSAACPEVVKYEGYFVTSSQSSVGRTKAYGSNKRYGYLLMERADMNLSELIKSKLCQKCKIPFS